MDNIKIFALGGLDEDGKNMMIVEINQSIFIIEAGLKYPEQEQLGIEMIIPDFTYLVENKQRIQGIFITHGHDDVMAALPHLINKVQAPIYTTPLTAVLIENLFKQEGIRNYELHRIQRNGTFILGQVQIRTFGVTQSIADGFGLALKTDHGWIVYTSEFIIDYDMSNAAFDCDISSLAEMGKQGVFALMTESVGSTREGHSAPNHRITSQLDSVFETAEGRIIITVYQQNIYRAIEVIELANKYNRKITFHDSELRALLKEVEQLGYYHIPAGLETVPSKFTNEQENNVIIVSGQGSNIFKRMHKIATKEDSVLELFSTDTVIIASPAVPGTEREASGMLDDLYKEDVRVVNIDSKRAFSMHASAEDIKMMLYLFKPKYFIPVKGEYRQLVQNANIALNMGYKADKILVLDNGQIAEFIQGHLKNCSTHLELEDVMVDGKDGLDATGMVLRDREILSTDGAIIVGVVVNHATKEIIGGPDIQSRGVIYLKDADYIMKEVGNILENVINEAVKERRYDNVGCRSEAREKIVKYILKETGKRPMVLPAIIEINIAE